MSSLKNRKASEALEIQFLPKVIERVPMTRRRCAVDVGANVGNWAIELAAHFSTVVAFEPVGYTFATLRQRIAEAKLEKFICPIQAAVMDKAGRVEMVTPGKSRTSTAFYAKPSETGVEAVRLDDMGIAHCGLLKLDLEGAELRALIGAVDILARQKPVILVEVIDKYLNRFGDTANDLHVWLFEHQYVCVDEQDPNRCYVPAC